jgi:phage tail-like protein
MRGLLAEYGVVIARSADRFLAALPKLSEDSRLPDPVGELRFKVKIDDVVIGAFSECSGLSIEYEVLEYQEGGEDRYTHKFRGRLKYPNLVLKRGVTHEDGLLKWFFDRRNRDARGALTVTLVGDDGGDIRSWAFAGAFRQWRAVFNAKSTNVAIETLEVAHQGLLLQV